MVAPATRRCRARARLRIAGADPLAVRLLLARLRVPDDGIDVLGFLSQDDLTAELLSAKALAAPSIGMESFGLVLTRAFACAVPVVASAIPGYRAGGRTVRTSVSAASTAQIDGARFPVRPSAHARPVRSASGTNAGQT